MLCHDKEGNVQRSINPDESFVDRILAIVRTMMMRRTVTNPKTGQPLPTGAYHANGGAISQQ
jgi:hypothetical protein